MKIATILTLVMSVGLGFSCGSGSNSKKVSDNTSVTSAPSITPTPEETPIPPSEVAQVDTSLDGPVLTVNDERQKTLNCTKFNPVSINADASVVTLKGVCHKIVVNGDRNQITLDAATEIAFNGSGNSATYSRFVNGKQLIVTDDQASNTAEFVPTQDPKKASDPSKAKK